MNKSTSDITPGATPHARLEWIKYQFRLRGSSTSAFASERLGVSRQVICNALRLPYPRVQRAIADELSVPVHVLWPEWYGPDGERLRAARRTKRRTA